MSLRIRVSRHGLTRCPGCKQHIQIAPDVRETTCPFCQAALVTTPVSAGLTGLVRGVASHSRSGLLAASLLGLTTLTGCGTEEDPEPTDTSQSDVTMDDASDIGATPVYGEPADVRTDMAEDASVMPLYGEPSDVIMDTAEDAGGEALYGGAPIDTSP